MNDEIQTSPPVDGPLHGLSRDIEDESEFEQNLYTKDGDLVASAVSDSDARRLIACWNACQSFPTEALENDALASLVEGAAALLTGNGPARGIGTDMVRQALRDLGRLP